MAYETAGPEVVMEKGVQQPQGVVLVVLDANKDISSNAVNWALGHVARKGDVLRLVGILTHVLNPMGYKCRVEENSWTGANRRILENELANKRYMLQNIPDLDTWCEKAGVELVIEVRVGLHPKTIVVEEAKNTGAYHVVLDRTMKKDRKYFIDNLTCFVTRVRNSGGVDSIRSFAISSQLPPLIPTAARSVTGTPYNSQSSNFSAFMSAHSSLSKTSSMGSSLRGSSVSSTTFTQERIELNDRMGPPTKQDSMASTGTSISSLSYENHSSCDDLFSINHETASERDQSLSRSLSMALDNDGGFGVLSIRTDTPRNSTPLLRWHTKANGHDDDSLKPWSIGGSPRISKGKGNVYQGHKCSGRP